MASNQNSETTFYSPTFNFTYYEPISRPKKIKLRAIIKFFYLDLYFKTHREKTHNFCVENLNTKKSIFALSFSFLGREMGS